MFKKAYQITKKSEFNKNVFTLFTGQIIVQSISFAVGFVITRIYLPEQIGVYSLFIAMSMMLSVVTTGRYEVAMIVENKAKNIKSLWVLALLISLVFNFLLFIVLLLIPNSFKIYLHLDRLEMWLFLIPLSVFIINVINVNQYYFNKHSEYKKMKNSNIIKSIGNSAFSLGLGWLGFLNVGLIIANIIGNIFSAIFLLLKLPSDFWKEIQSSCSFESLKHVAIKYKIYITLYLPSGILNTLVVNSTSIFIVYFFSEKMAGYYFMAEKVVSIPIGLIVASIAKVFYQKAANLYQSDKSKFLDLINSIQKKMIFFLVPFLVVLSIISPYFFKLFGEGWGYSGELVKYFSIFILLSDVMSPVGTISNILNRLDILFYFNVGIAIFRIVTFYFGSMYLSLEYTLLLSSITIAICYLILDIILKRIIKKEIKIEKGFL